MSLQTAINRQTQRYGQSSIGRREQRGTEKRMPAPVRGWNTRDGLSAMRPEFAVRMDNMLADQGRVRLRAGSTGRSTGVGTGDVLTLFSHVSGATSTLIACADGGVWDASGPTAMELVAAGTDTSSRWNVGSFLSNMIMVNGVDPPRRINADGTIAAAHGWTGVGLTPANLYRVLPYKARLLFAEKDSATLWYGPVAARQGVLGKFALDRFLPEGGNIDALGTLTLDSGFGVDDLLVIFMSNGFALVICRAPTSRMRIRSGLSARTRSGA